MTRRQLISGGTAMALAGTAAAQTPFGGPAEAPVSEAVIAAVRAHTGALARALRTNTVSWVHLDRVVMAATTLFGHAEEVGFHNLAPDLIRRGILANPALLHLDRKTILAALPQSMTADMGAILPSLPAVSMSDISSAFTPAGLREYEVRVIGLARALMTGKGLPVSMTGDFRIIPIDDVAVGTGLGVLGGGLIALGAAASALLGSGTAATATAIGIAAIGGAFIVVGAALVIGAYYAAGTNSSDAHQLQN